MKNILNKYLNFLRRGPAEDPGPRHGHRGNRQTGKSDVLFELLLLGADGSGKSTFIRQMQVW